MNTGALYGEKVTAKDDFISVSVKANSGEIWLPAGTADIQTESIEPAAIEVVDDDAQQEKSELTQTSETSDVGKKVNSTLVDYPGVPSQKSYEEMTVEELQEAILEKFRGNGPLTEQMKKDVSDNVYHDSLVTWVKSFS